MSIRILFILGTAREGRKSEHVARFVLDCAREREDIEISFADVREYPQTHTEGLPEEKVAEWKERTNEADGFVIISPEYNHGYPGELKMLLDNAYVEYAGKPMALCGVSDGPIGGARMVEQIKPVLSAYQAVIINKAVYVAFIDEAFDDAGNPKDPGSLAKRVNGMLDDVITYAKCDTPKRHEVSAEGHKSGK